MRHEWLLFFLPDWMTAWFAVGAMVAAILGMNRLAPALALAPLLDWILVPLAWALLPVVPVWVVLPALLILGFLALHGTVKSLFGAETAGQVTGTYLVRFVDAVLLLPITIVRALARALRR